MQSQIFCYNPYSLLLKVTEYKNLNFFRIFDYSTEFKDLYLKFHSFFVLQSTYYSSCSYFIILAKFSFMTVGMKKSNY